MTLQHFAKQLILLSNGSPAVGVTVVAYATSDTTFTTPLEVLDTNGAILDPLVTNDQGLLPEFQVDLTGANVSVVIVPSGGDPQTLLSFEGIEVLYTSVANLAAAASSTANNALNLANDVEPRSGARAAGQDEVVFNVMDYGAVPDDTTDSTAAIQAAIDALEATAGKSKTLLFPDSGFGAGYVITAPLVISESMAIRSTGSRAWLRASGLASNEYTLQIVDEPALGASAQENFLIQGLGFRGGDSAAGHIFVQGVAVFRIRDVNFHDSDSTAIHLDFCQDAALEDIEVFKCGNPGSWDGSVATGSAIKVENSNNIHFNMLRLEAPKTIGMWLDNSSLIKWNRGKIDSNVATHFDPMVLLENDSYLQMSNTRLVGGHFNTSPGNGSLVLVRDFCKYFLENSDVAGVTARSVVFVEPAPAHNRGSFEKGSQWYPTVSFRDCRITAQTLNDAGANLFSLVQYAAPAPDLTDPVDGEPTLSPPLPFTSRSFIDGDVRGIIAASNSVDAWAGLWFTDLTNGHTARAISNGTGGLTRLDDDGSGTFPASATGRYRFDHGPTDGVIVRQTGVVVQYRTRRKANVFSAARYIASTTISAEAYAGSPDYKTTLDTDTDLAAAGVVAGYYLQNRDTGQQWLIRSVTATQIELDFDVTGDIDATGATEYDIVAGKVQGNFQWIDLEN